MSMILNVQFREKSAGVLKHSFLLTNQTVSYVILRPNHFYGIGLADKSTTRSFAYGVK